MHRSLPLPADTRLDFYLEGALGWVGHQNNKIEKKEQNTGSAGNGSQGEHLGPQYHSPCVTPVVCCDTSHPADTVPIA